MRLNLFFLFAASWLFAAFGQASWIPLFGPLAAVGAYALFWKGAFATERPVLYSFLWFSLVQAVQISWMAQTEYMGPLIWAVYFFLSVAIGLQFAALTWLIQKIRPLSLLGCLALSGAWVWMEWARILPCTGFLWNPAGLALSASPFSLQAASLFGVYGLSFWVIFVNLAALRSFALRTRRAAAVWALAALLPFAFGALYRLQSAESEQTLSAVLVQPFLLPDERDFFPGRAEKWVPPLSQWERILDLIERGAQGKKIDLIVLPESAIPFPAYAALYPLDLIEEVWTDHFGAGAFLSDFPKVGAKGSKYAERQWRASNAFWMQAVANHYNAELIAGMEDGDEEVRYNAAFHFKPQAVEASRYEKRILVPIGEYVPLKRWGWVSDWVRAQFGISDSFEPGTEPKLFFGRVPMGISICMEEIYGGVIRESRLKGAELFVNLTNDGWFPGMGLARHHFDHGVIRAVENGVSALRVCCRGMTGAIDRFGRPLAQSREDGADALFVQVPLSKGRTAYSLWGDGAILILSALFMLSFVVSRLRKNPCPK